MVDLPSAHYQKLYLNVEIACVLRIGVDSNGLDTGANHRMTMTTALCMT